MMTVMAKKRGRKDENEEKKDNIESKSEVVTREIASVKTENLKKRAAVKVFCRAIMFLHSV